MAVVLRRGEELAANKSRDGKTTLRRRRRLRQHVKGQTKKQT